jgi:hypothetical protein
MHFPYPLQVLFHRCNCPSSTLLSSTTSKTGTILTA